MEQIKIKSSGKLFTLFFRSKNSIHLLSILAMIVLSLMTIYLDVTKKSYLLAELRSLLIDSTSQVSLGFVDDLESIQRVITYIGNIGSVFHVKKNTELQRMQYDRNLSMSILENENQKLKRLLSFVSSIPDAKFITAKIVNVVKHNGSNFAFLKAGIDEGIKVNQIVINEYGLIGRVSEVGKNFSRVSLVTDKSFRISVLIDEKLFKGVASGNGSAKMKLMYVPEHVAQGSKVITLGDDCYSPSGLIVGYTNSEKLILPESLDKPLTFVSIIQDLCNVDTDNQNETM